MKVCKFEKMKEELPELVIENCASGGHRLEPLMMSVSTLSSFSDAHEAVEIPCIAADLHNLMLPSKELIWAVLHEDDSDDRLIYSLAAAFFGRICFSGRMDKLSEHQEEIVMNAVNFYNKLENIIRSGTTRLCGSRGSCTRYPEGVQIAVRKNEDEILVICHAFENSDGCFNISIPRGFYVSDSFYGDFIEASDGMLTVENMKPFTAGAVYLKKVNCENGR